MPIQTITCPYCNNNVPASNITTSKKLSATFMGLNLGHSSSTSAFSYNVNCILCGMQYKYLDIRDFSWLQGRLVLSGESLESFGSIRYWFGYGSGWDSDNN